MSALNSRTQYLSQDKWVLLPASASPHPSSFPPFLLPLPHLPPPSSSPAVFNAIRQTYHDNRCTPAVAISFITGGVNLWAIPIYIGCDLPTFHCPSFSSSLIFFPPPPPPPRFSGHCIACHAGPESLLLRPCRFMALQYTILAVRLSRSRQAPRAV